MTTIALSTRDALLSQIPGLRASACLLCGNKDRADDLVQDTLLSAWAHLADFEEGTNMGAWLFTILRNRFRTDYRKSRRWVQDVNGQYAERLTSPPEQEGWSISADLRHALERLPAHQREAVVLVGAAGLSLEQAADVCGCEVGTIKSRTHRGRARLAELLGDAATDGERSSKTCGSSARHSSRAEPAVAAVMH